MENEEIRIKLHQRRPRQQKTSSKASRYNAVAMIPGVNNNAANFGHLQVHSNRSDGIGTGNLTTEAESALRIPIGRKERRG